MASFAGTVRRAFGSQSTLIEQPEHCSLDPERLVSIGAVLGGQVRVKRNAQDYALYTVSETREEADERTVRMALVARERLGTIDEFEAAIDTRVPDPTLTDEQAEQQSEFVERLDDNGSQNHLVVLAPHGGAMERNTDLQAERVAALLGPGQASAWRCRGYKQGGGAQERWHITSTDIHEASFPLLKTIRTRGFAHAVAFHGFSEKEVLIGGGGPYLLKRIIAFAIEDVLVGSGIPVRVATPSDGYGGDSPNNIVNRITKCGSHGVQIEQSLRARTDRWAELAEAVATVYRKVLCFSSVEAYLEVHAGLL
jgi:phage replication-related protein YjqB (UPF0714/DUF867 family)